MVDVSDWSEDRLEEEGLRSNADNVVRGAAKAELTRRQRKHELDRDRARAEQENSNFDADERNQVLRKQFDERLATENRAHAEKIAAEQLKPARSAATATRLAAIAAIASAVAAVASVTFSYLTYKDGQSHLAPPSVTAHPALTGSQK